MKCIYFRGIEEWNACILGCFGNFDSLLKWAKEGTGHEMKEWNYTSTCCMAGHPVYTTSRYIYNCTAIHVIQNLILVISISMLLADFI